MIYNPDQDAGYHARLYGENPLRILFWSKDSKDKQEIINICGEVRREMRTDTPIYDVG